MSIFTVLNCIIVRYYLILLFLLAFFLPGQAQQDVDLHLSRSFLQGKNVLKVKRDFKDPYLWVLTDNNEVYRIHSVTLDIDNYTSKFSSYSSDRFIDIAGIGPDQVFVATKSTTLIKYDNGQLTGIGTAEGIPGEITSIGVYYPDDKAITITTNNGVLFYNHITGSGSKINNSKDVRVFEATYRKNLTGGALYSQEPDYNSYIITYRTTYTIYENLIWYGKNSLFGNILNTVYVTDGMVRFNLTDDLYWNYTNFYWGTEKGLFQTSRPTRFPGYPHKQYLPGIPVNKVTSIHGLLPFKDHKLVKENLLIGTDQGLYFTSSTNTKRDGDFNDFTIYKYDILGNIKINDICVNATSYAKTLCEDGAWVATADGLSLLRPDYAPYTNKSDIAQGIMFEGQPGMSAFSGCGSIRAVPTVNGTGLQFQWYKDGVPLANQNLPAYNITSSGDYYAVLTDPCANISKESNHLKADVNSPPVFKFDYPDKIEFCSGSTANLAVIDKLGYVYRWYKDGQLDNNRTNVMNTTRPGRYRLELTNCTGAWYSTKEVEINFVKVPTPTIKLDKAAYCVGEQAVLTASVPDVPADVINWQAYQYQWYKDGVKIGTSTAAINVSQPGKYKVEVTSCAGNTTASADLQFNFISIATPVISPGKTAYCKGDQATLSVNFVNDGTYTVNWMRNGAVITAEKNKLSINTTQAGNYTVNITSNLTSCSQTSAAYALGFETPPTIIVSRVINTPLCSGQAVDLTATYSGGKLKWNTGETTDRISIKTAGTYTATATTDAGCTVSKDIDVQFLPNPTLAVPNAALCQFTNEKITLTAPSGFVKYEWNGQVGTAQYTAGTVGSVTLKVTDNNGCTASQTISITSKCKDIHIPNTFTPNGDGVNDKWLITGIEGDAAVTVKIYTRTGTPILQSRGYATPWDGTHKGTKVPAGVYYYVIGAKGAQQQLSGSITVLY